MKTPQRQRDNSAWIVAALLALAVVSTVASYLDVLPLEASLGPLTLRHLVSIVGATTVAVLVPIYHLQKKKRPGSVKALLAMHAYSNLAAFTLISVHFIAHYGTGVHPVVDTGTGFLLYATSIGLVATGILRRFRIAATQMSAWKFLHLSLTLTFYLVVARHVLRALRIF